MHVIWGCRNLEKAENARKQLLDEFSDACVDIITLDLSDLSSLKTAQEYIVGQGYQIDYLYNNAGVYRLPKGHTKDGYDLTIGTNALGTYVFTSYMLASFSNIKVIFNTSLTARLGHINYQDFMMETKYNKVKAYENSKLMVNHIYLHYLNSDETHHFALTHPGATYTPLINKGYKNRLFHALGKAFMKTFFHSPTKASLSALYCLNDSVSGVYVGPRGFLGLSGYPKIKSLPKKFSRQCEKTISQFNELLNY